MRIKSDDFNSMPQHMRDAIERADPALAAVMSQKKASKYGNQAVVTEEERFDSKGEYKRYLTLNLLEKAGDIMGLKRQVAFTFEINGDLLRYASGRPVKYVADFCYYERSVVHGMVIWTYVVEDFKGHRTKDYQMKCALMWAVHRIRIRETSQGNG